MPMNRLFDFALGVYRKLHSNQTDQAFPRLELDKQLVFDPWPNINPGPGIQLTGSHSRFPQREFSDHGLASTQQVKIRIRLHCWLHGTRTSKRSIWIGPRGFRALPLHPSIDRWTHHRCSTSRCIREIC